MTEHVPSLDCNNESVFPGCCPGNQQYECMCNVPTIEQRNYEWLHNHAAGKGDELDLIVNVQLMPEWEARGFITKDVEAFREKMNEEDIPGESAVLGTRKPGDRKSRRKATAKAKRHLADIYPLTDSVRKVGNGYIKVSGDGEVKVSTTDLCRLTEYKRADRRKSRHNGKAECREIPEYIADNADASEEERQSYQEKADGTVDIDFCLRHNWLYADLDDGIYGAEYDGDYVDDDYDDEDDDFEEVESYEEYLESENSRLKREINLYKDFIGEFNLNRLYKVWLAQNGKGECK